MRVNEYIGKEKSPFKEWFDILDVKSALTINTVITRMMQGNMSNIKNIGDGIFERVIDVGPGYRIYFGMESRDTIILLLGGTKKRQQKDISKAKKLWKEYKSAI